MDDYYDYYISRPPIEKGKALDFYADIDDSPDEGMTSNRIEGTADLSAITETEKESMASSESYQRREIERLDSFALEPEEVQKRFLTFLRERNKDIEVIELEDRITKDLDIDISDEEIRKIIGELNYKNKELRESRIRNKDIFPYDVERLKQDIMDLKKQSNYDKAAIKILRITLRKGNAKGTMGRTENLLTKEKRKDKLLERLQAVYDENLRLKQELQVQEQDFKTKIGKLNALNSELTKQLNSKFPPVIQDKDTSKSDIAAQAASLRLKNRALTEENSDLKNKIISHENDMVKLRQKIEDRDPQKFLTQIEDLKTENQKLIEEREKIIQDLRLDRQIKTLFPYSDKFAISTLNFVNQVEKNKFIKQSYSKVAGGFLAFAEKAFKKITPAFEKMGSKMMYFVSGKIENHPDSKKVIEATISAWNTSSFVGQHVKMQNNEIRLLEDRIKQLEGEIGVMGNKARPFSLLREEEGKKKTADANHVISLKELDNYKQQWESLPPFVKKYIKQLEGDVTRLQVKMDKRGKRKKKEGEEEKEEKDGPKPPKEKKEKTIRVEEKKLKENEKTMPPIVREKKDKSFQGENTGQSLKPKEVKDKEPKVEIKDKKAPKDVVIKPK